MNRSAETARNCILAVMSREFRAVQLNVRRQATVHESLMNDKHMQDVAILAIQEPQARSREGRLWTVPMTHHAWTKMVPPVRHEGRWAIRSMLWVKKELEAEQVAMPSPDVTAALVRLTDRKVLAVSVYVPPTDPLALQTTCQMLRRTVYRVRQREGVPVEVLLLGDFNQHDYLWGGDEVSAIRQGEADPIIDLMSEVGLRSLLPRGTKTWQKGDSATTIDLVLATEKLADSLLRCMPSRTEHGSDHRAIETSFDISVPRTTEKERLLLKNAPWKEIKARITTTLRANPEGPTVQQKADRLMAAVIEAVRALTPRAKPSPYMKRWWTEDLTQLRHIYTYWRNRARAERRAGHIVATLEETARNAAKQYHEAIRQQKKIHWEAFLADESNIWNAARYLQARRGVSFDKVPHLTKADGSTTSNAEEQAEELLSRFFPPLPTSIEEESDQVEQAAVPMPDITLDEIERALFSAKPWKAPGEDGLPAAVWKQTWPVVQHSVLSLFQ